MAITLSRPSSAGGGPTTPPSAPPIAGGMSRSQTSLLRMQKLHMKHAAKAIDSLQKQLDEVRESTRAVNAQTESVSKQIRTLEQRSRVDRTQQLKATLAAKMEEASELRAKLGRIEGVQRASTQLLRSKEVRAHSTHKQAVADISAATGGSRCSGRGVTPVTHKEAHTPERASEPVMTNSKLSTVPAAVSMASSVAKVAQPPPFTSHSEPTAGWARATRTSSKPALVSKRTTSNVHVAVACATVVAVLAIVWHVFMWRVTE
eukprot:COSAG05_NODE_2173_length_3440_cov_1.486980_2_plen_261_part_00